MNYKEKMNMTKLIKSSYSNTTGMLILKEGETLYEQYFNEYSETHAVHIASVTKSIISALIGIAIEKRYINSVNQKIIDFFPDYIVKEGEKSIQTVRIKNMLTMTAPYKYKVEPCEKFFTSTNWIETALDLLGGKKTVGEFKYSAMIGTHILSGILVKSTKQSVLDFATTNLFKPLGIQVDQSMRLENKEELITYFQDRNIRGWVVDPQGINTAGFGLALTPMEMAKIGQLYLDKGFWQGKQVIPVGWIDESTKEQSRWGQLSYGYLWWVINGKEHIYAALGDGGNVIYVNEKKNLVISMASLLKPRAKDRLKLIKEYIEPMC